jgi:hypothetical protein
MILSADVPRFSAFTPISRRRRRKWNVRAEFVSDVKDEW